MYRHAPIYYWADAVARGYLPEVAAREYARGQYYGVLGSIQLSFALGGRRGRALLAKATRHSRYTSIQNQAALSLRELDAGKRVADVYAVPKRRVEVEAGDDKVAFRVADLRGDEKKFAETITRLATGDKKARSMAKTLDRQLYGAWLRE